MKSEFPLIPLGEVMQVRSGFAFKSSDMGNSGHPIIKIKNINPPMVDIENCDHIPEEVIQNIPNFDRYLLNSGDTLIAMTGATAGKVGKFFADHKNYFLNQRVGKVYILENNLSNPEYIYQILSTKKFSRDILALSEGSAQGNISGSQIEMYKIPLPPIEIQNSIGNILSTFDKKIRLNKKTNQTLEEIAKTLFKSWFIDFDPVRAKAQGRPTGLSKEISDLFPDSFGDSELGEIPKGWKLLTFGDFVKPNRGKIITKKTTDPGNVPVVAGGLEPAYFHSTANVQGPVVTISASGANAGYVNLYHQDIWASDCSYISNNQTSNVFTSYIFLKINQRRIFDSQHGAAQPHVNPDDLKRLHMVSPNKDLFSIYENLVTPFFNKIKLNKDQSDKLISLRDTLLPKLISGELMVSEIESLTEEASV